MSTLLEKEILNEYCFEVYDDRPDFTCHEVKQIHSAIVILDNDSSEKEADGIFSVSIDTPLAIKTADCLPIVVIGKNGVALLHAGWKGLKEQILINENVKRIGPELIHIGPHIHVENYEVSQDFMNQFQDKNFYEHKNGKIFFNLTLYASEQIKKFYPMAQIHISKTCTFDNHAYNSYRRNKTDKRNWNILRRK